MKKNRVARKPGFGASPARKTNLYDPPGRGDGGVTPVKNTAVEPMTPPPHQQQQQQPMMPLSATVVSASTEDPPFPVTELNSPSLQASLRGWVSSKLCQYPQELVFRFDGEVDLSQLQILAHESKIPSRVEVLVAGLPHAATQGESDPNYPPTINEAKFKRLGFLSFISNEKTKFRSREKKTVMLSAKAYLLKLILHKCHTNALNTYNQVGLIHVQASGQMGAVVTSHRIQPQLPSTTQQGQGQLPPIRKSPSGQNYPAEGGISTNSPQKGVHFSDGGQQQPGEGYTPSPPQQNQQYDSYAQQQQQQQRGGYQDPYQQQPQQQQDPYYSQPPPQQPQYGQQPSGNVYRSQAILDFEAWHVQKTRYLVQKKTQAVTDEDYEIAKVCRDQLQKLESLTGKIYEFEQAKVQGIYEEDFDQAKSAKIRMDKLLTKAYSIIEPEQQLRVEEEKYPEIYNRRGGHGHHPHSGGRRDSDASGTPADEGLPPTMAPGAAGGGHAFEDQPVTSKYAQEMAEQAKNDPKHQPINQKAPQQQPSKKKKNKKKNVRDEQEEEEEPYDDEEQEEEEENEEEVDEEQEEQEEEDKAADDDDDEEEEKPSRKRQGGKTKKSSPPRSGRKQPEDDATSIGAPPPGPNTFDVESFEEWEKAVFFAIQDELSANQQENPDGAPGASDHPVDPRDAAEHTSAPEMRSILGQFATACLLSRRWKHREACIKVLTKLTGHLYPHQPTVAVVNCVLRYFDQKGFGLLDPILVCFLSSCEFLASIIEGQFPDCPLNNVSASVLNLIPRLIFRSADSTAKSREEAITLLLALTKSQLGHERVGQAVLADPVDAEKRKIPPQNYRVFLTRLMLLQNILDDVGIVKSHLTVDQIMNKLLIPCLNHSNNEVRELAINVVGLFDGAAQQEVFKYVHLVSNPSTKAAVDEKLSVPPPERHDDDGKPKHKRTKSGQ